MEGAYALRRERVGQQRHATERRVCPHHAHAQRLHQQVGHEGEQGQGGDKGKRRGGKEAAACMVAERAGAHYGKSCKGLPLQLLDGAALRCAVAAVGGSCMAHAHAPQITFTKSFKQPRTPN